MIETEEAVRRFVGGEEEAFSPIVRHWEKKIYNLAWRMVGNREDAQDIVQETFLSVFKSIKSLRDPGSFSTWVYRIALNHCRARRRSTRFLLIDSGPDQAGDEGSPLFVIPAEDRGDSLEIRDTHSKVVGGSQRRTPERHRSERVRWPQPGGTGKRDGLPSLNGQVPRISRPPGSSAQFETAGNH